MEWACMSHAGSRCEKDDQPNKKHTHEHIKPKYGKNVWNNAKRRNIIWHRETGKWKGGCPNKTRQSPVSSTNMDHKGLASTHWSFVAGAWAEHKQEKYNKLNKSVLFGLNMQKTHKNRWLGLVINTKHKQTHVMLFYHDVLAATNLQNSESCLLMNLQGNWSQVFLK